jgi:hypothetical protein
MQGADCGLDRVGKPGDLREGLGIRRHTSPANHRIPQRLDVLAGKKIRGALREEPFALSAAIVARTSSKMDIAAVGAIVMTTLCATDVVDRLAREGFGAEASSGDDFLAILVLESGDRALENGHILKEMAWTRNQSAS